MFTVQASTHIFYDLDNGCSKDLYKNNLLNLSSDNLQIQTQYTRQNNPLLWISCLIGLS